MVPPEAILPERPRSIVVGVGDSESSDHAVQVGVELGARLSIPVELVHALPLPDYRRIGFDPARAEEIQKIVTERARESVNSRTRSLFSARGVEKSSPGGTARPSHASGLSALAAADPVRVEPGPPARVLLEEARRTGGWIVLGSHGRRGLFDFGDTARAVLAKATTPVWLQRFPPRDVGTILVPLDLSADSLRALATARELARVLGASLHAVHCFHASQWELSGVHELPNVMPLEPIRSAELAEFERATSTFDWGGVEHTAEFVDAEPVGRILELARASDLIVLATHGRTGFAAAVLGSVAHAIIRRAERPVLAVPNPRRRYLD